MSEVEAQFVKKGLWVNWSQGAVMGHTLTIDSSVANVVVALLAICTSIGTAQLFNLLIFLYHQFRAHGQPSDGLYWQQQALLRTLPTPTALVADYMKLWWSWRAKSKREMDSGLLDISKEFGWNLKERDNVWVRRRTTCNVLPLEGHEETIDLSKMRGDLSFEPSSDEKGVGYRFGNYTDLPPGSHPEYLVKMSQLTANRSISYGSRTDADVAFTYISLNNVMYHKPVDDPLFSAHRKVIIGSGDQERTEYKSDALLGAIGCAVQHQFCAAKSGSDKTCSPLTGLPSDDLSLLQEFSDLTGLQTSLMKLLWAVSFLNDVTNGASTAVLQVTGLNMNGFVGQLPDDQWAKEALNWENYAWAGFQTMLSDTAVGPITRNQLADSYTDAPATSGDSSLCHSMKMRKAGGFANVNVFGLAFIVTFSAVISFINFFILRFFIFLKRFRKSLAPRLDRWVNDGIFQLQRRAFEANQEGFWTDLEKEIPVTSSNTAMSELPTKSRTIRRSATATTLVERSDTMKWDIEERVPTFSESDRSMTATSGTRSDRMGAGNEVVISPIEREDTMVFDPPGTHSRGKDSNL
ncbi:hypothetical protein N0V90_010563 [Kalmusia sp. IMI 367209]|nr:hypothetical protein N0V90_010563 [Kalmusia sp. IMI 367209]